jgi:WD40 repeat protein
MDEIIACAVPGGRAGGSIKLSHVFISYVREDAERVNRLKAELERRGVRVWIDTRDLAAGALWKDEIRAAIRHGLFFIACFSKASVASKRTYMNTELDLAIEELSERSDKRWFLPVLLDDVEVPDRSVGGLRRLRDHNFTFMFGHWDDAVRRLAAVIEPEFSALEMESRLRRTDEPPPRQPAPAPSGPGVSPAGALAASPARWRAADTVQVRDATPQADVLAVGFSPDGTLVVTGAFDDSVQLWSVPSLDRVGDPLPHEGPVGSLAFSPDGRALASAGATGDQHEQVVWIWDVGGGGEPRPLVHDDPLPAHVRFRPMLAFNQRGTLLATATLTGRLRVWDLGGGEPLAHVPDLEHLRSLVFGPFDRLLGTAGTEANVWDVDTGHKVKRLGGPPGLFDAHVDQVAFSPDGRLAATVTEHGLARVWDLDSHAEVRELRREGVKQLVFSQVGRRIVSVGEDRSVLVREVDGGDEVFQVERVPQVRKLACNPDGTLLAVLDQDGGVRLYDDAGGDEPLEQRGVRDLAFSLDGRLLATGGRDETVRLWASRKN